VALALMLVLTSCPYPYDTGISHYDYYYIYVDGDPDRSLQVTYLAVEQVKSASYNEHSDNGAPAPKYVDGNENVAVTKWVSLPFFKRVTYVKWEELEEDVFLEVASENDSTTKAVMFNENLLLDDEMCRVRTVWETEDAVNACAYCRDISKDSVLHYLKRIGYPYYLEFSKGDTCKKVQLRNWWGN
jgi:hypothetical protein